MSITAASGSSCWSRRRSDSTISTSFVLGCRTAPAAASAASARRPTLLRHREIIAAVEARSSSVPTGSSFGTAAVASWNFGIEMSGSLGISMRGARIGGIVTDGIEKLRSGNCRLRTGVSAMARPTASVPMTNTAFTPCHAPASARERITAPTPSARQSSRRNFGNETENPSFCAAAPWPPRLRPRPAGASPSLLASTRPA